MIFMAVSEQLRIHLFPATEADPVLPELALLPPQWQQECMGVTPQEKL